MYYTKAGFIYIFYTNVKLKCLTLGVQAVSMKRPRTMRDIEHVSKVHLRSANCVCLVSCITG